MQYPIILIVKKKKKIQIFNTFNQLKYNEKKNCYKYSLLKHFCVGKLTSCFRCWSMWEGKLKHQSTHQTFKVLFCNYVKSRSYSNGKRNGNIINRVF